MELPLDTIKELSEFYWETDISTKELQQHYGLAKPVYHFIVPLGSGVPCPNCGENLVYTSRSARNSDEKSCLQCGHKSRSIYTCTCSYCKDIKEAEIAEQQELRRQRELATFQSRVEETSSEGYVCWAISKLSRRERIFLKSLLEVASESASPTWDEICSRANVVSHRPYVSKLTTTGLLYHHPDGQTVINPSVSVNMIEVQSARNISNSLRFDVFQRDNHTCQYCGRRTPEVELEIDHLHPVSKGGTDDFENLVTSCKDCNRGKSAKLIERITGGYSRDEWRCVIRQKRIEALRRRREQLDNVKRVWANSRNGNTVSAYDDEAIHGFIERYDPDWIKAAIQIASRRRPSNYVKYVAGILRNWARNGPPDSIGESDRFLAMKCATDRQIVYIRALLDQLGLELAEFYHKDSYEQLTMLDARDIITALTQKISESQDNG